CATLHDRDNDGDLDMTGIDEIDDLIFLFDNNPAVSVEEDLTVPRQVTLQQNYPNPFNPNTTIGYDLPIEGNVMLKIYNSLGQEIRTLVDANQTPGQKSEVWDGKDNLGREVSSGIYVCRLIAGENIQSRKMLLLR
ncbi:MAG: T9SS type A sorting domain-containing protein, partial [Ignavibacteria bacterium]|nr:T9SS type A sorting domain-containing protein [Ignavibacteria bacterium]